MRKLKAFTIAEILVCVAVLGILAAGIVAIFQNVIPLATANDAHTRAMALDAAKVSYAAQVRNANITWDSLGSNQEKYALLVQSGLLAMAPPTLQDYQPKGFVYSLNGLSQSTTYTATSSNGN